jgi:hypothetical protein
MNTMSLLSLGYLYNTDLLYRGLTKRRRNVVLYLPIKGFLETNKHSLSVSEVTAKHLATPIEEAFAQVPKGFRLDTLIYFSEARTSFQSQIKATTEAQSEYLAKNKLHRMEYNDQGVNQVLLSTITNGQYPGVLALTTANKANLAHKMRTNNIPRIPYTHSGSVYGSHDAPNPSFVGGKFEVVSKGPNVEFRDPYCKLGPPDENVLEPVKYQTMGGGFVCKKAVVLNCVEELEKSILRHTVARPNEDALRTAQIEANAYALHKRQGEHRSVFDRLNKAIQQFDPKYKEPTIPLVVGVPSDTQHLIDVFHQAREEYLAEKIPATNGSWFTEADKYVALLGVKTQQRYQTLSTLQNDPNYYHRKNNYMQGAQKPDEGQKFSNGALKYARLFLALPDTQWATSDPLMMKHMKEMCEQLMVVEDNILKFDGKRYPLQCKMRDYWYRAVITDTSLEAMEQVTSEIHTWLSTHPGGLACVTHGDDQLYYELEDDVLLGTESDIKTNDGSHTDSSFRLQMVECLKQGYDPVNSFALFGKPMIVRNPNHRKRTLVLRSMYGMILATGHGGTTYCNTCESAKIGIVTALRSDLSMVEAAASIGYLVEIPRVKVPIVRATFLSKFTYQTPGNQFLAATEIASLVSNFVRVTGDLLGSNKVPVVDRFMAQAKGVVEGMVHEPNSRLLNQLRRLVGLPHSPDAWALIDDALIARYYPNDPTLGITHYDNLIAYLISIPYKNVLGYGLFGKFIVSEFIDTTMSFRYGMEPVAWPDSVFLPTLLSQQGVTPPTGVVVGHTNSTVSPLHQQ